MFLFFSKVAISLPNLYRGNWTGNVTLGTTNTTIIDQSSFQFEIETITNVSNVTGVSARAVFRNTSYVIFPAHRLSFSGIAVKNKTEFFLFSIPNMPALNAEKAITLISDAALYCNQTNYENLDLIFKTLYEKNQKFFSTYQIVGIIFHIEKYLVAKNTFDLDEGISGKIIFNKYDNITFTGSLFDMRKYIVEGMKYGVFTAITVILNWYAWQSLTKSFSSTMSLGMLSVHSFILHIGFDFSYALFVFDFSMQAIEFLGLYAFVFICMVSIYFVIQMKELALIWRANNNDLEDVQPEDLRMVFFKFFSEVSLLISLTSISISAVFDFPGLCLPFLYSFFIPQIVHSAITPGKKKGDEIFIILITLQRLFPLWYFSVYHQNIVETFCPKAAIFCTIYVLLQVVIILLQNKFGGCFFLPKSLRPAVFDYHSIQPPPNSECAICMANIEEGEDTMVTPCHHAFHTECLSRWMNEQLVCPICRATLPPLSESSV